MRHGGLFSTTFNFSMTIFILCALEVVLWAQPNMCMDEAHFSHILDQQNSVIKIIDPVQNGGIKDTLVPDHLTRSDLLMRLERMKYEELNVSEMENLVATNGSDTMVTSATSSFKSLLIAVGESSSSVGDDTPAAAAGKLIALLTTTNNIQTSGAVPILSGQQAQFFKLVSVATCVVIAVLYTTLNRAGALDVFTTQDDERSATDLISALVQSTNSSQASTGAAPSPLTVIEQTPCHSPAVRPVVSAALSPNYANIAATAAAGAIAAAAITPAPYSVAPFSPVPCSLPSALRLLFETERKAYCSTELAQQTIAFASARFASAALAPSSAVPTASSATTAVVIDNNMSQAVAPSSPRFTVSAPAYPPSLEEDQPEGLLMVNQMEVFNDMFQPNFDSDAY